jgi:hypothetical protein
MATIGDVGRLALVSRSWDMSGRMNGRAFPVSFGERSNAPEAF